MQKEHEQHIQALTTWQYNVAATIYNVQEKIQELHQAQEEGNIVNRYLLLNQLLQCVFTVD